MEAVELDVVVTRDAAARLRSVAGTARSTTTAGGAVHLPAAGVAAASLSRMLHAEVRCSSRWEERIHDAAGRLEAVVSAALAADRFEGASR